MLPFVRVWKDEFLDFKGGVNACEMVPRRGDERRQLRDPRASPDKDKSVILNLIAHTLLDGVPNSLEYLSKERRLREGSGAFEIF